MRTEASLLGVASLIDVIIQNAASRPIVEVRLSELELELDWLEKLANRYRSAWIHSGMLEAFPVPEETVLLLSWLVAPVTTQETIASLNSETRSRIYKQYSEITTSDSVAPRELHVGVVMGTVGRPVGSLDWNLPARLPVHVLEPEVALAYEGLIDHVLAAPQNWPEMHRSAVLWRLLGLAEGIIGEEARPSLKKAVSSINSRLPMHEKREYETDEWISQTLQRRNGLTHLRPSSEAIGFQDAAEALANDELVRAYVCLASNFAGAAINAQMLSEDPGIAANWVPAILADYVNYEWVESI